MAQNSGLLAVVAVVAIAALAVSVYTLGGGGAKAAGFTGQTTTGGGFCPTTGTSDVRVQAYNPLDPTQALVAAIPVSVYSKDSAGNYPTTAGETVYTSAGGINSTTNDPACGSEIKLVFGNNVAYYETKMATLSVPSSPWMLQNQPVELVGSLALTAKNATTTGVGTAIHIGLGSGQSDHSVVMTLTENTAQGTFGSQANSPGPTQMVAFDYPTSNYTAMDVIALNGVTATLTGGSGGCPTVASGYERCYDVKTSALSNYGSQDFGVAITTRPGVTPEASANMTVAVFDYMYQTYQGVQQWTVQSPADGTAIGATDVTYKINVN